MFESNLLASFPGSPRANEKSKKRGEPGRIYHVRNVIGRENLITCGRTNELAHAVQIEYSHDSFMADRMELDGTMLHYLAVRKAMVSVQKPVYSKITLTYSLTWQADHCTSQRMAFKALLNAKARPFPSLCSSFLCAYCWKKLPERAPTQKNSNVYCRLWINYIRAWAHRRPAYAQLSPLYPSLYPYVTHVINYSRPSPAFPYWKQRKAGWGLGTRLLIYNK